MPATTGSALSFLGKDNARVGDTGRIYYFARSEVWGMLKAYRGKASYLFLEAGMAQNTQTCMCLTPLHLRKEKTMINSVSESPESSQPAPRLNRCTIE